MAGAMPKPIPPSYPAPGTLVTIMDKDPRITAVDGAAEGQWSGAMWCPFAGTNVKLVGNTGPACGVADVYIDGIWQKAADWYSERPQSDVTVFAAANLPDGKHLLGILTRGVKRSASTATAIHWSRIEYIAGEHPERFVPVQRTRFDPNVPLWLDDRGEPIQGHMGGVMYFNGKYYMVGGDWRGKTLPGFPMNLSKNQGMVIYSSPDLMNWTCHGNFCGSSCELGHPLYNYTHGEGAASCCTLGAAASSSPCSRWSRETFGNVLRCEMNATAAAVADRPEGPYRWHGILQLDGKPVQGSDTAVFTDDDGKQYLITALSSDTEWNVSDCLYELPRLPQHLEGQAFGHRRRSAGDLQVRRRLLPAALAPDRRDPQRKLLSHGHEPLGPVAAEGKDRRRRTLREHLHDSDDGRRAGGPERRATSSGSATVSVATT